MSENLKAHAASLEKWPTRCLSDHLKPGFDECMACGIGAVLEYHSLSGSLLCPECLADESKESLESLFERAVKIPQKDYAGLACIATEDDTLHFGTVEEMLSKRANMRSTDQPSYLWAANTIRVVDLKIDDVLDNINTIIDGFETEVALDGLDDLAAALERFNKANANKRIQTVDYSKIIIIDEESE